MEMFTDTKKQQQFDISIMRPPNIPLITTLSVVLLLSCVLSSAMGLAPQQHPEAHRVVRRNSFIKARQPYGNALADDYGPPPPYYTGEPGFPTELTSSPSLEESTATVTQTGSSGAGTTFKSNVSTRDDTVSLGSSSFSISSALGTDTAMITAGSSAKAGSTSTSEAPSTAHLTASDSSHETDSSITKGITIPINSSSFSTHSSVVGDTASNSTRITGTPSLGTETGSPFTSASSVTVSTFLTETDAITTSLSRTGISSSLEASSKIITTDLASSIESSSANIESTTTTTKMLNVTVTVSSVETTISGLALPSTTYLVQTNGSSHSGSSSSISSELSSSPLPITPDQTTTITVIPQQSSSEASSEDSTATMSEEHLSSSSLASGTIGTITTHVSSTQATISESTQRRSRASGTPNNGTVSLTTTTKYFTSTAGISASSSGFSNSSDSSSSPAVASNDSPGAGTKESSAIVASMTDTLSTIISKTKTYASLTLNSPATNPSVSLGSTATLSSSLGASESEVAVASASTSSETLFASITPPVNVTSQTVTSSFTVITVAEGSIITIFPGGIIPTDSVTNMANSSVSTEYSTSSSSRFNSSTFSQRSSFPSKTNSLFNWSTSTLTGPQSSQTTPVLPSISFPTSWASIITTPMTPPSVITISTRDLPDSSALGNITVIKTTWTSTITTSLSPTGLASSGNVTASHTTSGYNFSKTLGSNMSTFNSWSTSFASRPDISSSIISERLTNVPFPTNTTIDRQSTTSSMPRSESVTTINSQGPETMSSPMFSGFNNTAPYVNSTLFTTKLSKTYSSNSRGETPSIITTTPFWSWNTTNTAQWLTNSTTRAIITATKTESDIGAGTQSLSGTTAITPLRPPSLNVTLTTISGNIITKPAKGGLTVSILTPPFFLTLESTTLSMILTSTPPFPFPSNVTMTGTGVPQRPSGTGSHPALTSPMGELSTLGSILTPSIRTTYRTINSTLHGTITESLTSPSSTNTPRFPTSNSTAQATATFSSIASWAPDPEPWTTWSTMSLTDERGSSTVNIILIYPRYNAVPDYYLGGNKHAPV
ncbi:putative MUC1-Extracellular alpha-1,4-glucan glucosidase [Fusarium austroafricanum]|uniref:Putative MUC1-Extracellular alpha-1,4-glucan glucosidase n=1 Tax=Fusarium austroafricanum TaxID=2364996 RepID=A0A8H4KX85_9HYPO|nr:putative MUC1-Extracellular alpha-1,4-glucan glucosidase [Fusarium austroafricanum]